MVYVMNNEGKPWRKYFEDVSAIPHGSFDEERISEYLVNFAKERGLWHYRDEIWNVIIKKPASPGYEDHPPVMLQAHTDMVCEKTPGSTFDFEKDSLELYVKDGWLMAKDTTLGADNTNGLCYMLAVLDDNSLKHPPIEAFFSVQEEVGIGGPRYVDYSLFKSKKLINFDMMIEGATLLATGNVVGGTFKKSLATKPNKDVFAYQLHIGGLFGGHGAVNIINEQCNAIKSSARIMSRIMKEFKFNIVDYKGGRHPQKNNIPTDAYVTFTCESDNFKKLKEIAAEVEANLKIEHEISDPNLYVELKEVEAPKVVFDDISTKGIVEILLALPTGMFMRSRKIEDFPVGSRNMGTLFIENNQLHIGYMFRAAFKSIIADAMDQTLTVAEKFGAVYDEEYRYSGTYDSPDTPLKKLYAEVYKEDTGKDLVYLYSHGGTDVGTIVDNIPGMDNVAFGPNTEDIHRPGERVEIESLDRLYGHLITMLERL